MAPASTLRPFTQWYSSLDGHLLLLLAELQASAWQSWKRASTVEFNFCSTLHKWTQLQDVAQRDGWNTSLENFYIIDGPKFPKVKWGSFRRPLNLPCLLKLATCFLFGFGPTNQICELCNCNQLRTAGLWMMSWGLDDDYESNSLYMLMDEDGDTTSGWW